MGDSFSQVYMKSNVRLQRKLEKADKEANKGTAESTSPEAIEALIRGDEINQQTNFVEETESDESERRIDSEVEDLDADSAMGSQAVRLNNHMNRTASLSDSHKVTSN